MYERILVPLDGSELAEAILPHAVELAQRCGAELILLQAVTSFARRLTEAALEPGAAESLSADAVRRQVADEITRAEVYLAGVGQRLGLQGVSVRSQAVEGAPGEVILDFARGNAVSLIAMSTHGRSGVPRILFGSVAGEVLRHARLPLLLIRPAA